MPFSYLLTSLLPSPGLLYLGLVILYSFNVCFIYLEANMLIFSSTTCYQLSFAIKTVTPNSYFPTDSINLSIYFLYFHHKFS